jgi:putative membrane protein insertion efficiency factor
MSVETATEQAAAAGTEGVDGSRPRRDPLSLLLLGLLWVYRSVVSPLLPPSCRFFPSCSAYALEAIGVHGPLRGGALAAWRVLRCGPWHPGGVDPVPQRRGRTGSRDPDRTSTTGA